MARTLVCFVAVDNFWNPHSMAWCACLRIARAQENGFGTCSALGLLQMNEILVDGLACGSVLMPRVRKLCHVSLVGS
ncbi:hypothetical protein P171DRAFT_427256 [Karstenula rhodostoma CBS 690.94]|uniref:Uncharacterized protein n=1 Tax=Karstenula rhodostoma CBS 690.94 TaxID=1392251 RepID=A0A9P4UGE5_9PLEO|nr:hypothetical protein P171DRAFT_427256 [Karstenula rhodostoma CBS 690.94]